MAILTFDKHAYGSGLDWLCFDTRPSRKALLSFLPESPADYARFFWFQSGTRYVFAFERAVSKVPVGRQPPQLLAARVATRLPLVPFIVVVAYDPTTFWFCAIDAHRVVLPGGDRVVASLDDALTLAANYAALLPGNREPDVTPVDTLTALLTQPAEDYKIHESSLNNRILKKLGGYATAGLIGGSSMILATSAIWHYQQQHPIKPVTPFVKQAVSQKLKIVTSSAYPAAAILEACGQAVDTAPAVMGGQSAQSVQCQIDSAALTLQLTVTYGRTASADLATLQADAGRWTVRLDQNSKDLTLTSTRPLPSNAILAPQTTPAGAAGLADYVRTAGDLLQLSASGQLTSSVAPWLLPGLAQALQQTGQQVRSINGSLQDGGKWQIQQGPASMARAAVPVFVNQQTQAQPPIDTRGYL